MADSVPKRKKLRIITYLHPGIPLELYQLYQLYLEGALGCDSYLMVESRWSGPPKDRVDPFTSDDADIGFTCSSAYLRLIAEKDKHIELLPVAPVHNHPKSEQRPIYFSEVIIDKSKAELYKDFHDLKGHKWAYNDEDSLSGSVAVLAELRKMGFDSNFFGHIMQSGSHHNSIQLVLQNTVDTAAIDSNVLQQWFIDHPEDRERLHVIHTIGPLPMPPIVYNTRMPAEDRDKVAEALLKMNQIPEWHEKLAKYGVWGFKPIDQSLYDKERDIQSVVKDMTIRTAYY